MCGIFGIITKPASQYSGKELIESLKKLALYSESRGQDSSGLAIRLPNNQSINIFKGDVPIHTLLKDPELNQQLKQSTANEHLKYGCAAFGHARLVTNGSQLSEVNNQPVIKNDIISIHNGIIVNNEELWKRHTPLKRNYKIDTEIIPALLRNQLNRENNLPRACKNTFAELEGTYSLALMFADLNQFILASNNGSLYYTSDQNSFIAFASEAYFLKKLQKEKCFKEFSSSKSIKQIHADEGLLINLETLEQNHFNFNDSTVNIPKIPLKRKYSISNHNISNKQNKVEVVIDPATYIKRNKEKHLYKKLEYHQHAIKKLKRCTQCLLPETFPFIEYDSNGVCNYCRHYKPQPKQNSMEQLNKLVEPYREAGKKPDCIVPFSGGRDSTYSLHVIKKDLGLKPIAFTYDWGMVTDLARRNIARVCGKLGVENIIVSANIHWKRNNIRKNVNAWLKYPHLGMIPLFMAGDKFFFYYCNQVKKQTGIDLNIWGINHLENTEFKTGFAGLPPKFDKKRIYSLSIKNQAKLFGFVAQNLMKSPAYLNNSILDSLGSFASRYIAPKKDYYHLFDYYRWNENEINQLIQDEYVWETAIDTNSTWRIGDGTASFYNYIYYTVAGFSEHDTFRSNQIREGQISREEGLKLIESDNIPRYETLRWYLEIIGVDFATAIDRINKIPKLYTV